MTNEQLTVLHLPYPDGTERTVRVFVPAHEEGNKLPVIYMTDGQNLFEFDNEKLLGCWFTREAVRAESEKSGRSAVIVGIHNDRGFAERGNELTPASIGGFDLPDDMPPPIRDSFAPCGEVFEDFVINTVMPAVEKQFPVKTGRENTAFCGSSSGGLESFYIVMNNPDKFGAGGVFSAVFMLYFKNELEAWIRKKAGSSKEQPFLYIYAGGGDEMEKVICASTEYACSVLNDCYPAGKIKKVISPQLRHHETSWEIQFKTFIDMFL